MPSAGRVRWAKFRVVALTTAAVAILTLFLYALFGSRLLEPKAQVYMYIPDASGLAHASPVRVDGIDVGRVDTVELTGSKEQSRVVKVTLSLNRDRLGTIPADSVAQISSDSLVGDKFVDITSGKNPAGIASGGELIYKNQPEMLRSLDLTQFTVQLRIVDAMLSDLEQGRTQAGQFVQGTEFYSNLQRKLADLKAAVQDSVSTSSMVGELIGTDKLHQQVSTMLVNVDQTIAQIQSGQGAAGQMLRSTAQYDQLLASAKGFRQSVATLAANDLMQSDAAYVSANQMLANLIQSVDELNLRPELTDALVYENLNSSLQQLRDTARDFRLNPKKYLRLKVF